MRDRQRRVCRGHYENLKHRLHSVIDGVNASVVIQLTPDAVEIYLDTITTNGAAARTVNTYLTAIKSFLNWAVMNRKIAYNPLDAVSMRPEHEKRKKRRPLTDDEIARLLACAEAGPLRRCRSRYQGGEIPRSVQNDCAAMGRRNALIYRIMLFTGLRRNEVKQLRWSDIDLDNGVITCRPEWTKNRKAAILPLHASLIDILKSTQRSSEYVVRLPHKLLRAFKDDLCAAGIAVIDDDGRSVDMHALRHTFAQRLCASGVDPKTMQGLMRHSSPALTLKVYVHLDQARMSAAMMNLPSIASR